MSGRPVQRQACACVALLGTLIALAATTPLLWGQESASSPIRFRDVTHEAGVEFRQHTGGQGRRHLPETSGSGGGWLDYDSDGLWDLYLVDSGPLPGGDSDLVPSGARPAGANAMFRNRGDGRFSPALGVAADRGHGRGVSFADYDNDGFVDIFVGNWGPDALYRNNGDGTFAEVTVRAGLGDERLASSSTWADLDADGWVDLYVVTYVAYDPETAPACGDPAAGLIDFCHPALFEGQPDMVFHNRADGTFSDRSAELAGAMAADGKGLAVAVEDLDDDGLPDIYVANDTTPNYVHFNQGDFRFEERGMLSGLGMGENGQSQAGMGIAIGYIDGDLDLAVANGHILELADDYPQPNQVFANQLTTLRAAAGVAGVLATAPPSPPGGAPEPPSWRPAGPLFNDASEQAGASITRRRVSRGLSVGDADGDGLADLLITNVNDVAELLHNVADDPGNAVVLRLRDTEGNRDAIGADVWITPCPTPDPEACSSGSGAVGGAAGYPQRYRVRGASSYASQSSNDLHVGLGASPGAQVQVRWPDGAVESLGYVAGGRVLLIVRGRGVAAARTLAPHRVPASPLVQDRFRAALLDERLDMRH